MMAAHRHFWSVPRQLLGCVLLMVLLQVVPASRDEATMKGRLSKCVVDYPPFSIFPFYTSHLCLVVPTPTTCSLSNSTPLPTPYRHASTYQ